MYIFRKLNQVLFRISLYETCVIEYKNNNIVNIENNYKLFVSKQVIDTYYLF
jgi:hypothetical protein